MTCLLAIVLKPLAMSSGVPIKQVSLCPSRKIDLGYRDTNHDMLLEAAFFGARVTAASCPLKNSLIWARARWPRNCSHGGKLAGSSSQEGHGEAAKSAADREKSNEMGSEVGEKKRMDCLTCG